MKQITKFEVGNFTGSTLKIKQLKGFTLSSTHHLGGMEVPNHEHELPYISMLLNGIYLEESCVSSHFLKNGSALFRPKGFEHENTIGKYDSLCFNLEIDKALSFKNDFSCLRDYIVFEENNLELFKIYYAFLNDYSEELLSITVEENLHTLCSERNNHENLKGTDWIKKVKKEIRLSPERKLTVDAIANDLDIHPNYFIRKFKAKVGFTFGEYLIRQRISKAIDLMLCTKKSLTQISVESGFYDQSHFIKHFKLAFKTTPSHYRKLMTGYNYTIS